MKWLVLLHVMSAIIGIGPTFFGHVLYRSSQSIGELRQSMLLSQRLDFFPKVGGSIAVLSGIVLVSVGNYGSFLQLWLIGSLILFIIIEVVVIGLVAPPAKKLTQWLIDPNHSDAQSLPAEQVINGNKARNWLWVATILGILLFVFMIMKPDI